MKILFLAPRLPHAGITGGNVIVRERITRLAVRGHEVGLACFTAGDDLDHANEFKSHLVELRTRPLPKPRRLAARAVHLYASHIPPYFADYLEPEMQRIVGDMVERGRYDIAVAEFSPMAQYLFRNPYLSAVRKIASCHYSVAASFRRVADIFKYRAKGVRSWLNIKTLQRYELEMFRHMDRVLTLTMQERFEMLHHDPALRITAVAAGVDTAQFAAQSDEVREDVLLFSGHYENLANRDAVMWFAHAVWPMIKRRHSHLKFHVVGPGPTPGILSLAQRDPSIVVTGAVPDIRDQLARACLFVCPVRLGWGLRVKMLEAMAMGLPIVTTSLGSEGLPLYTGENCLVADDPKIMADSIDLLLTDRELRHKISRNARALVTERFSWDNSIAQLERLLAEVCERKPELV